MQQQNQPSDQMTIWEKVDRMQWLMRYPALTVMVFLRADLGYRIVNPVSLFFSMGIPAFIALNERPRYPYTKPRDLFWFAVISLSLGIIQRLMRWSEMRRGNYQHSYYIGTSPFDFRWLPNFIRRNRKIARYFDSIFCFGIGYCFLPTSASLGLWLMFAGFSLRCYEEAVQRKVLHRTLDTIDGLIASEGHSRTVEAIEAPPPAQKPRITTGIPTGLGSDIKKKIKRRKAKK